MREKIEKSNVNPEICDHIRIAMYDTNSETVADDITALSGLIMGLIENRKRMIMKQGLIGKTASKWKRKVYLQMELSFKREKACYVCSQCGEVLSGKEYQVYKDIFQRAYTKGDSVSNIKRIFKRYKDNPQNGYKKDILKGRQRYSIEISRIMAANISLQKKGEDRYETALKFFEDKTQ